MLGITINQRFLRGTKTNIKAKKRPQKRGRVLLITKFAHYASILLRLRPKNPMPEAKSHAAAGTGTSEGRLTAKVPLASFVQKLAKSVIFQSHTVVLIMPDDGRPNAS